MAQLSSTASTRSRSLTPRWSKATATRIHWLRYLGMADFNLYRELGQQLRVDAVRASAKAGSGHPTSSMSAADLAAVLLAGHFRYDFDNPRDPRERPADLLQGPCVAARLRHLPCGGRAVGGGVPHVPPVRVAARGTPDAGAALGRGRDRLARPGSADRRRRGDRGQEARPPAVPRLGDLRRQRARRRVDVGSGRARRPLRARQPDGDRRRQPPRSARRDDARLGPRVLLAPARVDRLEGDRGRRPRRRADRRRVRRGGGHDRAADGDRREDDQGQGVLEGRGPERLARQGDRGRGGRGARRRAEPRGRRREARARRAAPLRAAQRQSGRATRSARRWRRGARTATRSRRSAPRTTDVVALDGEVSNSTYAEIFQKAHPERFFEMFIAEQQMVAAAVGIQLLGWKPFASTFAAFLSRAYDFVRMAAISRATIRLCGSHAGVSIGEDGPSQMALEDIAALRAVHGSTVLYPCDGNQTAKLVRAMGDLDGISFLRTTRADTPVVYEPDEEFPVGGSKTLRDGDDVAVDRGRHHRPRGARGGRDARGRGDLHPRDRPLLREADRCRDAAGAPDADRHGRGPLARGRARRGRALGPRRPGRSSSGHEARGVRHAALGQARRAPQRGRHRRRAHRRRRAQPSARARAKRGQVVSG